MWLCGQINKEITEEVLAEVIFEKGTTPKPNPVIRYNRFYLQNLNPKPSSTSIPPLGINYNSLNFRENRTNIPKGIQELREKQNCHFCGDKGHIKRTCVRKQIHDNNTKSRFNNPTIPLINLVPPQIPISFDLEFLESARGLTQLRNPQISLDELIRIRTIVN